MRLLQMKRTDESWKAFRNRMRSAGLSLKSTGRIEVPKERQKLASYGDGRGRGFNRTHGPKI